VKRTALQPSHETAVRARTRALLVDAAVRVFARKGAGAAAIHEITGEAGVANGTFYNYFRTREEILEAASMQLAGRLSDDITAASVAISDPAERIAIGNRRFVLNALRDPTWAAALLRVWASTPLLEAHTAAAVLADLRLGRRRKRLRYASEAAALDLVHGTVLAGMRTVLEGRAGEEHATAVAALVLRALGLTPAEADEVARRPLPAAAAASSESSPSRSDGTKRTPRARTRRTSRD
jgi:AcrR family transcriptional regulator